jgi:DNA-binding MarR family transcriptional regulator
MGSDSIFIIPFHGRISVPHPKQSPRSRTSAVQSEIRQSKPFRSTAQEATIALLRTASIVHRALARVVEPSGLSLAQYNALRIIRGAGTGGIATLSIRERMIEEGTTITRLLDKLEDAGLIRRERTFPDRRQVLCFMTDPGRKLLDTLDPVVNAADEEAVSSLSDPQLARFIDLLDAVRKANAERGAPRSAVVARA